MSKEKVSFATEELAEMEECPCEICTSQGEDWKILKKEKIDEAIDIISNEMIDYLLENTRKDLLKTQIKQDKVE